MYVKTVVATSPFVKLAYVEENKGTVHGGSQGTCFAFFMEL